MLKSIIILVLLLPLNALSQSKDRDKIDAFLTKQLDYLDNRINLYSIINIDSIDTATKDFQLELEKESRVIEFFEKLTGIKAEVFHAFAYGKLLKQSTVDSWRSWIIQNQRLLIWERTKGRVNRSDRDIYLLYDKDK
jgi:hypothetical protein